MTVGDKIRARRAWAFVELPPFAKTQALRMWDSGCDTLTIARALSCHESRVVTALWEERENRRKYLEWEAAAPTTGAPV